MLKSTDLVITTNKSKGIKKSGVTVLHRPSGMEVFCDSAKTDTLNKEYCIKKLNGMLLLG